MLQARLTSSMVVPQVEVTHHHGGPLTKFPQYDRSLRP
jgi:hypothetical protein